MNKSSLIKTLILLGIALLMLNVLLAYAGVPSEPHPANAIWVEPSTITLTDYNVGDKFNVTVWANVTTLASEAKGLYTWQVVIYYNTTYLNVSKHGLTGDYPIANFTSELFENHTTVPVRVVEEDYVGYMESLMGTDYLPVPACASLFWVEFNVTALQPQPINFALNITHELTYLLDDLSPPNKYTPQLYDAIVVHEFSPFLLVLILTFLALVITIFHKKGARNFNVVK